MAPLSGKKRKSAESQMTKEERNMVAMGQKVPTKTGSPSAAGQESPYKKRKTGITVAQKQALIDNLQLEITERARKLRADYNSQAQNLRTRIELRIQRIPRSLLKVKMGDLLEKYSAQGQQKIGTNSMRGPPVPEKDFQTALGRYPLQRTAHMLSMVSPVKRTSRDISGGDKENEVEHVIDLRKKAARLGPAAEISRNPGQVLSPASSNSRIRAAAASSSTSTAPSHNNNNHHLSPMKSSGIARPVSPFKSITNMVEKAARSTATTSSSSRNNNNAPTPAQAPPSARRARANTTSTINTTATSKATRTRTQQQPPRPATRTGTTTTASTSSARRASGVSESSEGSTGTVVRKRPGTAMSTRSAPGGTTTASSTTGTKRGTVMSTIKKGVASASGTTRKGAAAKAAPASATTTTSTGRVLRKRG